MTVKEAQAAYVAAIKRSAELWDKTAEAASVAHELEDSARNSDREAKQSHNVLMNAIETENGIDRVTMSKNFQKFVNWQIPNPELR